MRFNNLTILSLLAIGLTLVGCSNQERLAALPIGQKEGPVADPPIQNPPGTSPTPTPTPNPQPSPGTKTAVFENWVYKGSNPLDPVDPGDLVVGQAADTAIRWTVTGFSDTEMSSLRTQIQGGANCGFSATERTPFSTTNGLVKFNFILTPPGPANTSCQFTAKLVDPSGTVLASKAFNVLVQTYFPGGVECTTKSPAPKLTSNPPSEDPTGQPIFYGTVLDVTPDHWVLIQFDNTKINCASGNFINGDMRKVSPETFRGIIDKVVDMGGGKLWIHNDCPYMGWPDATKPKNFVVKGEREMIYWKNSANVCAP